MADRPGVGRRGYLKTGIELARQLPADVLHLALAYGLLQHAYNSLGVSFSHIGVHPRALTDLREEFV